MLGLLAPNVPFLRRVHRLQMPRMRLIVCIGLLLSLAVLSHPALAERTLGTRKVSPDAAAAAPAQQQQPKPAASSGTVAGSGQKQQLSSKSVPQQPSDGDLKVYVDAMDELIDAMDKAAEQPAAQDQSVKEEEQQEDARVLEYYRQHAEEQQYRGGHRSYEGLDSYEHPASDAGYAYPQKGGEQAAQAQAQMQTQQAVQQPTAATTESYDDSYAYADTEDTSCPTPQQADDVKQAYLSHGHFSWRELAKESSDRRAAQAQLMKSQAGATAALLAADPEHQQGKARAHRIKGSVLQRLVQQQNLLQSQQEATKAAQAAAQQAKEGAQAASTQSQDQKATAAVVPAAEVQAQQEQELQAKTADSGSNPSATVSVAAVDNIHFLMPTSMDETGYGYHGVRAQYLPSDQAIAVGPHPIDPESVMVIQGAQGSFEVNMVVLEDGQPVSSVTNNRLFMSDMMEKAAIDTTNLYGLNPSAWYDPKEKRYVLMWASGLIDATSADSSATIDADPKKAFPLFIAVSANRNPLGEWVVWALDTVPQVAPGFRFCSGQPLNSYAANTPQGTFTDDAVIVSLGVYCGNFESDDQRAFLSVVYAYSKRHLYSRPPTEGCEIYAATYLGPTSWYRSVPPSGQALVENSFKPFNSFIQPARPQEIEDVAKPPVLVMKVSDTMLSIATLTGEPLDKMTSLDGAPKIIATLVGKGGDFSNDDGQQEGVPVMPQPGTFKTLDAGDVGTVNRTHELRVYWATHHHGLLYLTASEYWGSGGVRMPSIYWSVVKPNTGLCAVKRRDWGVVASEEGLAVAYPVIAARKDGSVTLAFAYSGAGQISDNQYPAYPGVATANVGEGYHSHEGDVIQIVKRSGGIIARDDLGQGPQYWGTYSAAQVWDGRLWFAVVIPEKVDGSFKHGAWVSAVDISQVEEEQY